MLSRLQIFSTVCWLSGGLLLYRVVGVSINPDGWSDTVAMLYAMWVLAIALAFRARPVSSRDS